MPGAVMFVDDEPMVLSALQRLFEMQGDVDVYTAASAEDALKVLRSTNIDVVVTDQCMPGMNGLELVQHVKERCPDTERIMFSGFDDDGGIAKAVEAGDVRAFLEKPWDNDELLTVVRDALDKRTEDQEETLLLRETTVTRKQLERARRVANHLDKPKPLRDLLLELKYLSQVQYDRLEQLERSRLSLIELLLRDGAVDPAAAQAYQEAKAADPDKSDRTILVGEKLCSEEDFLRALASKENLLFVEPQAGLVDSRLVGKTSLAYLRKHLVLPLLMVEDKLNVVMADPLDTRLVAELERIFEAPIVPQCATSTAIQRTLDALDGGRAKGGAAGATTLQYRELKQPDDGELEHGEEAVQVVDYLLLHAIQAGASDLHIEPMAAKVRTRIRVDGVLRPLIDLPVEFAARVVSRLKILAGADIAERRLHQDGRILIKIEDRDVDIRFSSYATVYGENLVLRILDRKSGLLPLAEQGFAPPMYEEITDVALKTSTGLVLLTGPTGSGKTTTLYSCVDHINRPEIKVITCEDPVEYRLDGVIQCNVNEKTGPTFADSLRAILRQDPDVILVGEVRDEITAGLAVEAALTGHKVLSTLHTEDAVGAVIRLLEMGTEPFMIASTLSCVIAQRLVRRVCGHCVRPKEVSLQQLRFLGLERKQVKGVSFVEGAGCARCEGQGYRGRTAIHEVLLPDDALRDAILRRATAKQLRDIARRLPTFFTLLEDGVIKAIKAQTSLAEVLSQVPRDIAARDPAELKRAAAKWRKK